MSIFGKAFKGLKKIAKVVAKPVAATIARTVIGSVPVLGGVVSAVGAVKHAIHPPTRANTANVSARTGAPAFGHPHPMLHRTRPTGTRARPTARKRPRAPAYGPPGEYHPRRARRASARAGGSAKQRAARARFAKAAKRGRIRKGQRL